MKSVRIFPTIVIALFSLVVGGCAIPSSDSSAQSADGGDVLLGGADASPRGDAEDASDASVDVREQRPGEPHARPHRSTYVCDDDETMITYKPIDEPFVMPDNDYGYEPVTMTTFQQQFGQSDARAITAVAAAGEHAQVSYRPDVFAVRSGDDVKLHVALWAEGGPFPDARLIGTVLNEYQEVRAKFEFWDQERENIIKEITDTGITTSVSQELVLVDITIPSDSFPEPGAYELGLYLNLISPGDSHAYRVMRLTAFYGGYSRPAHPCFTETTTTERSTEEDAVLSTLTNTSSMKLYPAGETSDEILKVQKVSPGETVLLKYFKLAAAGLLQKPTIFLPLLRGRPIGEPTYIEPKLAADAGPKTNWRGEFDVDLPQEPGLYPISIVGFEDARLPQVDRHGIFYDDVYNFNGASSSNTVWYEVVESQ